MLAISHTRRVLTSLVAAFAAGWWGERSASGADVALRYAELPALVAARDAAVVAAAREIEAADTRRGFLRRSFGPDAGGSVGVEGFQTGALTPAVEPYGGVRVSTNLFRGGRDALEEREHSARAEAARSDRDRALRVALEAVRARYWDLAAQHSLVALVERHLREAGRLRNAAARRISKGLAAPSDRAAVAMHEKLLTERIESARREARILGIRLAGALGVPPGTTFEVSERFEPGTTGDPALPPLEGASDPDAARLRAESEAHRAGATRHARWWAPSLDAYALGWLYTTPDRTYESVGDRREWTVGLRLGFSFFDGGREAAEAKAAAIRADAHAAAAAAREATASAEREAALEAIRRLQDLVASSNRRTALGRKWLAETLDEYGRGVRDSIATLSVFERVLDVEVEAIERQRDLRKEHSSLESRLGR